MASLTTLERVRNTAHHLKAMDDADLQIAIEDASEEVLETGIKNKEKAARYLAAHKATLNFPRAASEAITGAMSRSFIRPNKSGLARTEFGEEYGRMLSGGAWLRSI